MFGQIYFRVLGIGCFLSMALLSSAQRGCVKTKAHLLFYLKIVVPLFLSMRLFFQ